MAQIIWKLSCFLLLTVLRCFQSKRLLKDHAVTCHSDRMDVQLEFDEPFGGIIFADRAYNDSACRWEGRDSRKMNLSIPISMPDRKYSCGTTLQETTGELMCMLVASPMKNILVDGVTSLQVQCLYAVSDVTITMAGLQLVGVEERAGIVTGSGGTPKLQIQILDGHGITGKSVTQASVGQRLTLDIVLKDTAIYDFYTHSCVAHDGTNSADASVQILDANGCAVALPRAIEVPVYVTHPTDGSPKHIYVYMYGFQFTSSQYVHFECQARPCIHSCKRNQCEANSATTIPEATVISVTAARFRRESQMKVMKLLTILEMRPPAQTHADGFHASPSAKASSGLGTATCPPIFALIGLFFAVGLMPSLTVMVCYAIIAHRRQLTLDVQRSLSHSGIYSEPISTSSNGN